MQTFVELLIDSDMFFCEEQQCDVYIFMNNVGGVCPSCQEIGSKVGR